MLWKWYVLLSNFKIEPFKKIETKLLASPSFNIHKRVKLFPHRKAKKYPRPILLLSFQENLKYTDPDFFHI